VQRNNRRQVTGPYAMQRDVADLGVARPMVAAHVPHAPPCVLTSTGRCVGNSMWLRLIHRARETPWSSLPSIPTDWRTVKGSLTHPFLHAVEPPCAPLLVASAWLHAITYAPGLRDTGFHPLDGAGHLVVDWPPAVCNRVATAPERFRRPESSSSTGNWIRAGPRRTLCPMPLPSTEPPARRRKPDVRMRDILSGHGRLGQRARSRRTVTHRPRATAVMSSASLVSTACCRAAWPLWLRFARR
jgi:hypothetical protein